MFEITEIISKLYCKASTMLSIKMYNKLYALNRQVDEKLLGEILNTITVLNYLKNTCISLTSEHIKLIEHAKTLV